MTKRKQMTKRTPKTAGTDSTRKTIIRNEPFICPDCEGDGLGGKSGRKLCRTCCGAGVLIRVRTYEVEE
jgi:DnaJ-class molecular chaperone